MSEVAEKIRATFANLDKVTFRPMANAGVYDPMEQAGHADMVSLSAVLGKIEGFEKKHIAFAKEGKIYGWLEENIPHWAEKGCRYINILTLFIEKEILGE